MKPTKIIILTICALLVTCAVIQGFAASESTVFGDVSSKDWFAPIVLDAYQRGIINGYPDGSFRPEKQVSYAEFLAMSMNLEKMQPIENSTHWAEAYYRSAINRGIISASDFGMQDLDKTIPREHMALILSGLIKARGKDYSAVQSPFSDTTDSTCRKEIALCSAAGVLSGYPDGSFKPANGLKRSEAASAVMKYVALLDSELITGGKVAKIYENGSLLVVNNDGSYEMYYGNNMYMEAEAPDPKEDRDAGSLIRDDHKNILDQVLASAKISGASGSYTFTYTQPQIPDRYHFATDLHVFKKNSQGGADAVFFENSDSGWIMHPENYDPSARTVTLKLSGITDIQEKSVIFKLQIYDILDEHTLESGEGATYVYSTDFDGSTQFVCEAARYYNGEIKDYRSVDNSHCPAFCW